MRIRRRACCRADGRLYCIVDLEGAGGAPAAEASAEASLAGSPIPAELYPYEDGAWVVVLPFLARARLRVTLAVGEERGSFDVNCARARWESSLVYRLRKDLPPGCAASRTAGSTTACDLLWIVFWPVTASTSGG